MTKYINNQHKSNIYNFNNYDINKILHAFTIPVLVAKLVLEVNFSGQFFPIIFLLVAFTKLRLEKHPRVTKLTHLPQKVNLLVCLGQFYDQIVFF